MENHPQTLRRTFLYVGKQIMSGDSQIKKKIEGWLLSKGYPLEMKVATEWRKGGFNVVQAHYYSDPENHSSREIDIVASCDDWTGWINIEFVIECKSSKKHPWLLFSSDDTLVGSNIFRSYCISSESARMNLIKKCSEEGFDSVLNLAGIRKTRRAAYSMTRAFTTGEDATFKAATSALKAAIARRRLFDSLGWKPFCFIFPTVIVDGLIFDCFLDDLGRLQIESIEDALFFFPWMISGEVGTCIRVLSLDALPKYVAQAKLVVEGLKKLFEKDIEERLKQN